ncbi:MAG: glycosyltransferase [Bacteroidetes bacterium]|nr:glycosyltransferase [Bacteroidota bacterium]
MVDNHSVDGSVEMMKKQFSGTRLIAKKQNSGFSKGNNEGIRISSGEYVLLLNPDTIVKIDSLQKMVDFMETHEDAGGLGVKMMDGKGHYLPESKRGFPTPAVAFYKMSGLSKLFPTSAKFNQYHQGHLSKDENHVVDVLSGACMLLRRSVLDKIGLLDEDYFMYGEDIDLSYRIKQSGYRNYYLAETEIIHFKGESTRKGSFNYVRMFYNAMIIFTRKHMSGSSAKYLTSLMSFAIYIRASAALFRRIIDRFAWPLIDAGMIYGSMVGIKHLWETAIKEGTIYPASYLAINVPLYIAAWLLSYFSRSGYDPPVRLRKIPLSIGIGTVVILAIYALLPEHLRSSRGMIISGALAAVITMTFARLVYYALKRDLDSLFHRHKKILIVADRQDGMRITDLITQSNLGHKIVGIAHETNGPISSNYLGNISDIPEISRVFKIDEIIFSLKDISSNDIMKTMSSLGSAIEYKIISEGSEVIIGSHSKDSSGELYTVDIHFHLNQPSFRRSKRIFDIISSLFLLMLSPLLVWFARNKKDWFPNIVKVLSGRKTWVSYHGQDESGLPPLDNGVLPVTAKSANALVQHNANVAYAKDYEWWMDLKRLKAL